MSVECPSCDRDDFHSEGSMRGHHTKIHGEKLPNRECNACGDMFYDPNSKLRRCNDCNSFEGELNPAYKSAKEEGECKECGEVFEYYPSSKKGDYCSDCVSQGKHIIVDNIRKSGKNHPSWKGGKIERECSYCEETIEVRRVKSEQENVFCDIECCGRWKSENIVGEDHHHWKGGGNTEYGKGWTRARSKTLKRDNFTCQRCFTHQEETDKMIDVHHIKPVRTFDVPEKAHTLDNLVTLCRSCHRKVEYNETVEERRSVFNY